MVKPLIKTNDVAPNFMQTNKARKSTIVSQLLNMNEKHNNNYKKNKKIFRNNQILMQIIYTFIGVRKEGGVQGSNLPLEER